MTDQLYPKGKENIGKSNVDFANDTFKVVLTDASYSQALATDAALDDIPGGARVATSGALQNPSMVDGVFDADDISIADVSGNACTRAIVFKDSGVESTSWLIATYDISVTPVEGGGQINLLFHDSGLLAL